MTYTYTITIAQMMLLGLLAVWEIIWKGLALWRASRRQQTFWFIALLLINSIGILPIAYLLLTRTQSDDSSVPREGASYEQD